MDFGLIISDALGILRRRWYLFAVPFVLGSVIAGIVAWILPATYSSTARILVESQQIPEELVRSTVTSGPTERLRLIEQRLLTRQNLLDIADKFDVFDATSQMSQTDIVTRMRASTDIDSIVLATQGRGEVTASAINITFRHGVPQTAARVANEFLTQVLSQNVKQRNELATSTLNFFNQEVKRLGDELSSVEQKITATKNENADALPDSLAFRRTELNSLHEQIYERNSRQVSLEDEAKTIRELLNTPGGVSDGPRTPEEAELARLRQTLVQQRAIYTDTHPSIRSLQERIGALEAAMRPARAEGEGAEEGDEGTTTLGSGRESLVRRLSLIETQLKLIEKQRAADEERIKAISASILKTPEVEAELGALERQRDNLQIQYQQAVLKQAEAAAAEQLEVSRKAERFEVIEQPEVPARPDSPNRLVIVAAGVAGSGGLGLGLMLAAEFLFRCIRSPRDLEAQAGLLPIVTIPYIETYGERRAQRLRFIVIAIFVTSAVSILLYGVDQFVMPLPVLGERLADRLGLVQFYSLLTERF